MVDRHEDTRRLRALLWISLCLALAGCQSPARTPRLPGPGEPHVTLMSYNVNFGIGGDRETIALIRTAGADLVFLQETTAEWEIGLRRALGDRYPYMQFRHCCRAGGLGVLSRYPLLEEMYLPAPEGGWFPGWRTVVQSPLGPLQVLNVHLRPPVSDAGSFVSGYFTTRSLRELQIATYVEQLDAALPTLVVGDFNEDAGGRALAYLHERGLRSALPDFFPGAPTWRWQTRLATLRDQLDHVVHDARLEPIQARTLDGGRSDHLPVVVTLVAAARSEAP